MFTAAARIRRRGCLMFVLDIVLAILGISVLVIIHEGGHYLSARLFGMRVLRYSIGFGPTLFHYKPKDSPTTFQVGAIPLLAYVQIAGMNPHEEVDPNDPEIYPNKSVFARIVTIIAGPVANYLTASLLVLGLGLTGFPRNEPVEPMRVAEVVDGSPAEEAGLKSGDVIVEANGEPIETVEDLIDVTAPRAGEPTEYVVVREGERLGPIPVTPESRRGRGMIGVRAEMRRVYEQMTLPEAGRAAFAYPAKLTMAQLQGLTRLIEKRTTEGLTGPVGMGKMVAKQARKGAPEYLSMLMLLSVALGMFNLLPFPALDGGRLVFLGYELVTRRRPNERFEAVVHMVGLLFLLGVLVLVTFRDVMG